METSLLTSLQVTLHFEESVLESIGLDPVSLQLVNGDNEKVGQAVLKNVECEETFLKNVVNNLSSECYGQKTSLKRKSINISGTSKKPAVKPVLKHPPLASTGVDVGSLTPTFGHMADGRRVCPVCMATFADRGKATRHFNSIHGGKQFLCDICGSKYGRKDQFKDHLMKKHSLSALSAKAIAENC